MLLLALSAFAVLLCDRVLLVDGILLVDRVVVCDKVLLCDRILLNVCEDVTLLFDVLDDLLDNSLEAITDDMEVVFV